MSLEKGILKRPPQRPRTSVDVPPTFLGFCEWLGVALRPGQAELVRVAFDGVEPVDRGIASQLFGPDVPVGRRSVVAAVCGARAGKSYVLVALRLLHGMLVRDVSQLPPGVKAAALIIAPRDDLRTEVFRYALGAVESKPELAAMLANKTADTFRLRRPDGYEVEFKTGVATSGGTAARGQWWTDFALDECAFFRDSSYKVNDEELFRAGSARVLPGGQTIIASTPWTEAGLLHRMWKTRPTDTTVVHAPTLALNDTDLTREIIARARQSDEDNARREFDAVFMTGGTTLFFEPSCIDAAITNEPFVVEHPDQLAAGADFGFRSDSSALVLVALRGGIVHVFDGAEERPREGVPLKPSVTVKSFAKRIEGRCKYLMADGHYREAIAEHLAEHGVSYVPAPTVPAETYVRARMLLREGKVKIHSLEFRDRLLQQMREVHGKPTSGGGMSIVHQRWATGGHGDLVAAFVLALWQAWGAVVAAPPPTPQDQAREERARRFREEAERPYWQAPGGNDDAYWRRG